MRTKVVFLLIISILFLSCFEPPVSQNGTLSFQTTINEDLMKSTTADTCLIEDLLWRFASFEVSTGRIIEGAPDTLEWISVYSDTTESWLSEFQFEAELASGTYRSIRLGMRNRNWWLCEWADSLIEIEDWNRDPAENLPEDTPYSYYDFRGCWYCDEADTFYNVALDESIADIVVGNGVAVDVTMNWNMYKIVLEEYLLTDSLYIVDWIIREGHDMIEWNVEY